MFQCATQNLNANSLPVSDVMRTGGKSLIRIYQRKGCVARRQDNICLSQIRLLFDDDDSYFSLLPILHIHIIKAVFIKDRHLNFLSSLWSSSVFCGVFHRVLGRSLCLDGWVHRWIRCLQEMVSVSFLLLLSMSLLSTATTASVKATLYRVK